MAESKGSLAWLIFGLFKRFEVLGKVLDCVQNCVRFGCADSIGRRKWTEDADRADAGSTRHLNVFRSVAYVEAFLWLKSDFFQREI